jgi:hypothetical protein
MVVVIAVLGLVLATTALWRGADRTPSPVAGAGTWTSRVESLPEAPLAARRDVTGVWTGSQFLVWGGRTGTQAAETLFADGAVFDQATRTWHGMPASPLAARAGHQAVWTGTEMFVWGGEGETHAPQGLVDGATYNPTSGTWRQISPAPGEGRAFAKTLTVGDKIVIAGGQSTQGISAARTVLIYDLVADRWSTFSTPLLVYDAVSVDGTIVLAGLDASTHVQLEQVGIDGTVLASPVDPPVPFAADRLSLALAGDSLVLAVSDFAKHETRLMTGQAPQHALPTRWSSKTLSASVLPAVQVTTGYRGLTVTLATDTVLLAAVPQAAIVNTRTGRVPHTAAVRPDSSCGISGALAWTGTGLLSWGGQTCQVNEANSATGVLWTPSG